MKLKRIMALILCFAMVLSTMSFSVFAEGEETNTVTVDSETYVASIGEQQFKTLQDALDAAAAGEGNVTVEILENINLTDVDWNPVTVSAPKYPVVTVNGNGKIITGLNDMLFAGTWAGGSGLIINDLTIADSAIVNDKDDEKGTVGVGAFIGFPQASATVTLNNCHLVNSSVEGGHWTGGLIGYAAGYAGKDGPVFMNLTINECSVTGSTITGKGSAGGIIGHATGNAWTQVTITDTTVSGNNVTSTGSSTNKAGAVIGTIGAAGQATTVNGVEKTGGVSVAATVSGNNVTSNSAIITTIYGRQGTDTGMLYVTGGKYDNYPIEENVAYAAPLEGYEIADNGDGTFGVSNDTPWYDPDATEYHITNADDLWAFAEAARAEADAGNEAFSGKTVYLDADIDLEWAEWYPINFYGTLEGNDNTIKNLTYTPRTDGRMGFFQLLQGTANDLTLDGIKGTLPNGGQFGGFARYQNGNANNVHVKNMTLTIGTNCNWTIGGFFGYTNWGNATDCSVENFVINAPETLSADGPCIGGFIGSIRANSTYTNCDVKGFKIAINSTTGLGIGGFTPHTQTGWQHCKFIDCDVTGIDFTVSGTADVAGFITWPGSHTTATNCTTEGKIDVTGVTNGAYVGGFYGNCGWNADLGQKGHLLTNCSADVDIITKNVRAGGFIGSATVDNNGSKYFECFNCSASGDITAVEGSTADIGGFAGDADRGVYNDCTASGTVTNNGTGNAGQFVGAIYDVTPKYDGRYPAGTRDYLADEITVADCTYTGASNGLSFIGYMDEKADVTIPVNVAKIGDEKFGTLSAAIAAAEPNDTITLLAAVTENVTIDKNITIDGADKNYTGKMTISKSINLTIDNVNFIGGNIIKPKSTGTSGTYTIKNCSFDSDSDSVYAIEIRGSGSIIIENCTSEGYFGFLQVPSSNNSVSIKDVTIDDTSYAIKVDYSNGVNLEKVTIENSTYGFVNSNFGTKTIAVKNCTIKANYPLVIWDRNTKKVNTFKFEGNNDFGANAFYYQTVTDDEMDFTKYVLAKDATLTAVEGLAVTADNPTYHVVYEEGVYKVEKVAKVGENYYYSLQEAIDAANDGDTITLIADIKTEEVEIDNKKVVIDLNGNTMNGAIKPSTGDITVKNGTIINKNYDISAIEVNEGTLVVENVNIDSERHAIRIDGAVDATINGGIYKVLVNNRVSAHTINVSGAATVTIKDGTFYGPKGTPNGSAMGGSALQSRDTAVVTVEGGNFSGGVNNTIIGKAVSNVSVKGGTFDQDPTAYVLGGYKVVKGTGSMERFYVVPEYKVSAVVNDDDKLVQAGETFTVSVKVTGGAFTNAGWSLKFDESVVEYVQGTGVAADGMIISEEIQGAGGMTDEFEDGKIVATYTFTAKTDIFETKTAVFEIVNGDDADEITYVDSYAMAGELNIVEADKISDTVTINLKSDKPGTLTTYEVVYDGTEHRGNMVAGVDDSYVEYIDADGKVTKLPPAYKNASEYNYKAKITLPGIAPYYVEAANDEAEVVIKQRDVKPTVEFNVDPDVDKVEYKPVIAGVVDGTFTGKVTVTIDDGTDRVVGEFDADDFEYDGNGNAIYTGQNPIVIDGLATAGDLTVKVVYTAGEKDNYATSEGTKTVNVDKITDENVKKQLRNAVDAEHEYNGTERNVVVGELPAGWSYEITGNGITEVGKTVQTVKFTDGNGKYNDYTYYVTLEVTPREVTLAVNEEINKTMGVSDEEFGLADEYTITHAHCTETPLVNADDLGTIQVVRVEEGEEFGKEYDLTVNYTPNRNYKVSVVPGILKIDVPVYKVEVVDNKWNGNDATPDYTAGNFDATDAQRLILVYTNADAAYFTCEGKKMYDVTERGYKYVDHNYTTNVHTEEPEDYKHVYAMVVDADMAYAATEEVERHYRHKVKFAGSDVSFKPEKVKYDANINQNPYVEDQLDTNDYSMVNGIYNAQNALYDIDRYQLGVLKADTNGDKIVDTEDADWVKRQVVR